LQSANEKERSILREEKEDCVVGEEGILENASVYRVYSPTRVYFFCMGKCMGELKSVVRAEREEESADEEEGRVLVVDL
jgi:hypothetical protein